MYGYDLASPADTRSAMQSLAAAGVTTVEIEFSGGNDEGGVDEMRFLDAGGNTVEMPKSNAHESRYWTGGKEVNEGWMVYDRSLGDTYAEQKRPATDEEIRVAKIDKVLTAPIYARYYSFAGEFYVHGTVTWDVAAGTHDMSGQESHEVWEDI